MIPLRYIYRNLGNRWLTTVMTVVVTGFVVWASILAFGLKDGLENALLISGDPLELIVLRKGANDETSSEISEQTAQEVANMEGIARSSSGEALSSAEFVTILTKPRRGGGGTTNVIVRGLEPIGRELRPNFRIVAGHDLQPGLNQIITSKQMAERFENMALGERLDINKVEFEVVGYFEAGGSAAESEVWADRRDLSGARRTPGAISCVNLRAVDQEALGRLTKRVEEDEQFKLKAVNEIAYYESQLTASVAIKFFGYIITGFLTIGAMFAAAITMYAAVASRTREIGTLRALGFSRTSVLVSFVLESVLICLAGGVLGCIATLPWNGLSTGTANWNTFSEITFSFRLGPAILFRGVLLATLMGILGGIFPAVAAVRMPIVGALRNV